MHFDLCNMGTVLLEAMSLLHPFLVGELMCAVAENE